MRWLSWILICYYAICDCLGNPEYVPEVFSESLLQKAKSGEAKANVDLGIAYFLGKGVQKNSAEAFALFQSSSQKGNVVADYYLALCYGSGEGTKEDKEKAIFYLKKAAEQGLVEAENTLAGSYTLGDGVEKDKDKALSLLHSASEKEFPLAMFNYASFLIEDSKNSENIQAAYKIMKKLADYGDTDAQRVLGTWNLEGKGTEKNDQEGFRLISLAAERGNTEALYQIAELYEEGKGTEKNLLKAIEYYARYAEFEPDVVIKIGALKKLSENEIKIRDKKVFEIALFHALRGNKKMQSVLASLYQNGLGVEKNIEKAIEWFKKAADQNWEPAKKALKQIEDAKSNSQPSTNPQQNP